MVSNRLANCVSGSQHPNLIEGTARGDGLMWNEKLGKVGSGHKTVGTSPTDPRSWSASHFLLSRMLSVSQIFEPGTLTLADSISVGLGSVKVAPVGPMV